jgi:cytochrome c oxidase cbb3-type subunit 3
MVRYGWFAIAVAALCAPAGARAQQSPATQPSVPPITPPEGLPALVPLGHVAGAVGLNLPEDVPNPLQGQSSAVESGKQLFIKMNCAGCHGYAATGNMGPNLSDKYWRYGGTPVDVFKSIFEGRPQGMPSWGGKLSSNEIWQLVSYIESLGGTFPADFYHQALQGDRKGELEAPELASAETPPPQQPPKSTAQ